MSNTKPRIDGCMTKLRRDLQVALKIAELVNMNDPDERIFVGKVMHFYICDALANFYKLASGNDTVSKMYSEVHQKTMPGKREARQALKKIEELLLEDKSE